MSECQICLIFCKHALVLFCTNIFSEMILLLRRLSLERVLWKAYCASFVGRSMCAGPKGDLILQNLAVPVKNLNLYIQNKKCGELFPRLLLLLLPISSSSSSC